MLTQIEKSISVVEAGRRGGLTVLRLRGNEFFSEIGKKGQAETRERYPGMASEWGKRGGRPRKGKAKARWAAGFSRRLLKGGDIETN
jgi:general stress protein YciG